MAVATLFSEVDNSDMIFDANTIFENSLPFQIFVAWDETVDGLNTTDFSISGTINTGNLSVRIRRLQGSKRLFSLDCEITSIAVATDTDRNGRITLTLNANAVTQGNPRTTLTFNYNFYRRDLEYPYTNTRPDDFQLLKSNIGRMSNLTYADGVIYGKQHNSNRLVAFDPATGNEISAKHISIPSGMDSAILLNGAVYGLRNKELIKCLPVSGAAYTNVVNAVGYQENKNDTNSDFIAIGRNGFYVASESQTGQPGTPGTPTIPGTPGTPGTPPTRHTLSVSKTRRVWLPAGVTAYNEGPGIIRAYVASGHGYTTWLPNTEKTFSGRRQLIIRSGAAIATATVSWTTGGSPGTPSTPTIPGTPGRPSTEDFGFIPKHFTFDEIEDFQEISATPKQIFDEDKTYLIQSGEDEIFNYVSGAYDYADMFVIGYDGEDWYLKIGPYVAKSNDFLTIDTETITKTVSPTHLFPPAYAFDDRYIYRATNNHLYRYEKAKLHRPIPRHQTYPVFVSENSTVDLRKYIDGATRVVLDEGTELPNFMSLSGYTLSIGSVSRETGVQVKLRSVNRRGATEEGDIALDFVVLKPATSPEWIDIQTVSMEANTSMDVSTFASNFDRLSAVSLPTGASFTGNRLRIGSVGGLVTLRAIKGSNVRDVTFTVDIETIPALENLTTRNYVIEIAGVDVSADLLKDYEPVIEKSLDLVRAGEYKINTANFALKYRAGYYDSNATPNFWSDNSLNPDGYREQVKVYLAYERNGNQQRSLIFLGDIKSVNNRKKQNRAEFAINDSGQRLRSFANYGDGVALGDQKIEKYVDTFDVEEGSYEGVYQVEDSLTPILRQTVKAWEDARDLRIKKIKNPSEGVTIDYSAYVDHNSIRTQGGSLEDTPILKYQVPYRNKRVAFFIDILAQISGLLNPAHDIAETVFDRDVVQSKGNIQYNTLKTRITHVFRDWVYDSVSNKVYILLSQPDRNYRDVLVSHDIATDRQQVVKEFPEGVTCVKLAYAGSNIFYILTTDGINQDFSVFPTPSNNLNTIYAYDKRLGANSKILRYDVSSDSTRDFVAANAAYPAQPGSHYYVGFSNEFRVFDWEPTLLDTRGGFKTRGSNLYYRFANGSRYGVARVSSGGSVTALWQIGVGNHFEHLKFDFDVNSRGVVYFAHVVQTATGSELIVRKHESGSATTVLRDVKTFSQLTDGVPGLSDAGGWYSGVHEVLIDGDDLYLCVEIGRTEIYYSGNTLHLTRSVRKGAGQLLYKVDVSSASPSLSLIEANTFVQQGATALTPRGSDVFYAKSPPETYAFEPNNPDFEDTVSSDEGKLKSIDRSGAVSDHGFLWFDAIQSRGVGGKMLNINDNLHLNVMYSNPNEVLAFNSAASSPDNSQWIKYGQDYEFILDSIPNASVFATLADIARKVNASFEVDRNRISIAKRDHAFAYLSGNHSATTTTIFFNNANALPNSGLCLIGNEIVTFTGRTGSQLTGVTRGTHRSQPAAHSSGAKITILDTVITPSHVLSQDITTDTNRVFNIIQSSDELERDESESSIARFGELPYALDLGLDRHSVPWIDEIYAEYLQEFESIQKLATLTLTQAWNLKPNDITVFRKEGVITPIRVMSVRQTRDQAVIIGRTLPER